MSDFSLAEAANFFHVREFAGAKLDLEPMLPERRRLSVIVDAFQDLGLLLTADNGGKFGWQR